MSPASAATPCSSRTVARARPRTCCWPRARVVVDGALGGHIDVVGRRLLGFERRRVVAGPELPEAPPLMAELRSRVLAATPDEPWGWFDRAAGFALERVTDELDAAGVTTPLRLSNTRRMLRHDTLIVSASAEDAARERLLDALAGRGTQSSIALGAILHRLELLEEVVGRRDARRLQVAHARPRRPGPARRARRSAPARGGAGMSSLRSDVMLLTHGGGGLVVGAAALLDGVLEGSLDVLEGRRVVAGPRAPGLARCWPTCAAASLGGPPASPHEWIVRAAAFAPHRIACELIAAGVASPLRPALPAPVHALRRRAGRGRRARPDRLRPGAGRAALRRRPADGRPAPARDVHAPGRGAGDPSDAPQRLGRRQPGRADRRLAATAAPAPAPPSTARPRTRSPDRHGSRPGTGTAAR